MIRFDFRSKFVFTVALALSIFTGGLSQVFPVFALIISLIPFAFLAGMGHVFSAVICLLIYLASQSAVNLLPETAPHAVVSFFFFFHAFVGRLVPVGVMGYYTFASTRLSDMTQALKRAHMPQTICIAFQVMFRFFASIRLDYKSISEAMRLLDMNLLLLLRRPTLYFEYKLVPLFMVVMSSADDVAIAAMCRGLEVGRTRTTLSTTKLRALDWCFLVLSLTVAVLQAVAMNGKWHI